METPLRRGEVNLKVNGKQGTVSGNRSPLTAHRSLLFSGAGVLIVALLAIWFFANHERVAEEIEVGYHGEARVNPLLAAQRLLAALRFDVRSMSGLEGLPPGGGTLVLATRREAIGPSRAERI